MVLQKHSVQLFSFFFFWSDETWYVLFLLLLFINLASVHVYDFHPWFYDFDQSLFFLWKKSFLFFLSQWKNWKKSMVAKMKPSSFATILPLRGRRLVSHGDRPRPLAPGGPQGADGGDGRGHAGPLRQLGLGQQLPAALQRHGPGLEAVPARGRRRGKYPHQVCVT